MLTRERVGADPFAAAIPPCGGERGLKCSCAPDVLISIEPGTGWVRSAGSELLAGAGGQRGASRELALRWLDGRLTHAIQVLGDGFDAVNIRVVGDATMETLHARYCGDPSTADVLTFMHAAGESSQSAAGAAREAGASDAGGLTVDLVLCVDEASRQAARRGHPVEHELLLYAVHGLLHCLGFDDRTIEQADAMHREEDRILTAIGVGRTYFEEEPGSLEGRP
jgi:probable rRNA maturation factor